jgi:hypothetical protein
VAPVYDDMLGGYFLLSTRRWVAGYRLDHVALAAGHAARGRGFPWVISGQSAAPGAVLAGTAPGLALPVRTFVHRLACSASARAPTIVLTSSSMSILSLSAADSIRRYAHRSMSSPLTGIHHALKG